jgi:hypothetical protein
MIGWVIGGLLVAGAIFALWILVAVQGMSDEDREAMGHGPKGQGR